MKKIRNNSMIIALGLLIEISTTSKALKIDSSKSTLDDNTLWNVGTDEAHRLAMPSSKFNQTDWSAPAYDGEYFSPDNYSM